MVLHLSQYSLVQVTEILLKSAWVQSLMTTLDDKDLLDSVSYVCFSQHFGSIFLGWLLPHNRAWAPHAWLLLPR